MSRPAGYAGKGEKAAMRRRNVTEKKDIEKDSQVYEPSNNVS